MEMKDYEKGDEVWFVANHYDNKIAIKCAIDEVDDYFRKKNENAYLFYHLDIVIGHTVASDELFDSKEQVKNYFDSLSINAEAIDTEVNFEEWHQDNKDFVISTWEESEGEHPGFDGYDDDKEWFTLKQYKS